MEITSAVFYVMVAASLLVYWKLPWRFQWTVLFAASLLFYLAMLPVRRLFMYVSA